MPRWAKPTGWNIRKSPGGREWVEKARSACDQAVAIAPKLAEGWTCLGSVSRATGEYEKAVAHFQKATALDPTSDDAFRGLAEVYQKLNQPAEAEATFRKAISLRPQYWAGYSWLGAFFYDRRTLCRCREHVQRSHYADAGQLSGLFQPGRNLCCDGPISECHQRAREIGLHPPHRVRLSQPGYRLFLQRNFEQAASNYEQGLKFEKTSWLSWGNFGDAYYQVPGKRDQALNAYGRRSNWPMQILK